MGVLHLSIQSVNSEFLHKAQYSSTLTLTELKAKLELVVSVLSPNMRLKLHDEHGKFLSELTANNDKTLEELGVADKCAIHVEDVSGSAPDSGRAPLDPSARHVMDSAKYESRKGKKCQALVKLHEKFLDGVCENLIELHAVKNDLKSTVRVKVTDEEFAELRASTISRFCETFRKSNDEIMEEEKITEKFSNLKNLSSNKKKSGWRPSGDPARDSYGHRRPALLAHIARLESLKTRLEQKTYADDESMEL